jgi:lipopolysaccharide export system permease protein
MRLLTAYVLKEIAGVFLVTLTALTALMLLVGMGKEAVSQGLGLLHIIQLVPYLLPNALQFAIPGTMLFAVTNVYGRMAGSNEIVAIKSLGISPTVVIWPVIALAVLLSLFTVWVNDLAVSWGYQGVQRVVLGAVEDIAYSMLKVQKSYSTRSFSVSVTDVRDRKLINPIFSFQPSGDAPQMTITAEEAELRSNLADNRLKISCRNGTVDIGGATFDFPDVMEQEISLDDAARKERSTLSAANIALRELSGEIAKQHDAIDRAGQEMALIGGFQLMTGDFAKLSPAAWEGLLANRKDQQNRLYRLQTEPPRRWANGFSCLCFALVGMPLAMWLRNSDMLTSFFMCFGPILIAYYPLLAYGVDRAKAGAMPAYTVWLANGILALVSLYLLRKVLRY